MRISLLFSAFFTSLMLLSGCGPDDTDSGTAGSRSGDVPAGEVIPFDEEGEFTIQSSGGDDIVTLQIEIAETDSARIRGMMQRESFPDETSGMLFPFENEAPRYFHMSNTPLSLDLFFIDSDSTIVSISKYARPFSSDLIESGAPAQYVLETPAGFADTYGITVGDRATWTRTDTTAAETAHTDTTPTDSDAADMTSAGQKTQ
jgi:hypothetical protein